MACNDFVRTSPPTAAQTDLAFRSLSSNYRHTATVNPSREAGDEKHTILAEVSGSSSGNNSR